MSQMRQSLEVLNIPSPCTVPWRTMSGTAQVRFCKQCRKDVHNLSAMTAAEAENVLNLSLETPCVRFYRRFDGTVVTTDRCGNRVTRSWRRFTAAMSVMFVALVSLAGCDGSKLGFCTQGKPAGPRPVTTTTTPSNDKSHVDDKP